MRWFVAFLLFLSLLSSGVAQEQRTSRGANKSAVSKPRGETIRICQGVPIPDGYIVIAYMTSSACPHGAYVLKKQEQYESSLSVNSDARPATGSNEPSRPPSPTSRRTSQRRTGSTQSARDSAPRGLSASQGTVNPSPSDQNSNSNAIASLTPSRPRRATGESQDGPPKLIGDETASRPLRPPKLTTAGTNATGSEVGEPASAVPQPTPEEVDEGDVVRVDTTLVTVPVSVLDRQGRFVPNLKREDFSIFENGVEQPIAYFEPAEKPFTVALLLDTSPSTHFHLSEIREAAIAFAKQLRPQDRVLIVSFNNEVLLLTEATNDQNLIETVIEENANTGTSTRLYDAVDLTIKERLNKIKGRKAIVLFTDGVDTSSRDANYETTLREVEELDALIYPIQYDTTDYLRAIQGLGGGTVVVTTTTSGPFGMSRQQTYTLPANGGGTPPPGSGATKADYDRADQYLHALADKTGGRLYEANDTTQLADAFTRIAEELRRQYSLGYYPKTDTPDRNDRRQIRVKVRQPNLAVRARDSYTKSSGANPDK